MNNLYPMFKTNWLDRWCLRYARKRIKNKKSYYVCFSFPPFVGVFTRMKIMEAIHPHIILPAAGRKDSKKEQREERIRWIDMLLSQGE